MKMMLILLFMASCVRQEDYRWAIERSQHRVSTNYEEQISKNKRFEVESEEWASSLAMKYVAILHDKQTGERYLVVSGEGLAVVPLKESNK